MIKIKDLSEESLSKSVYLLSETLTEEFNLLGAQKNRVDYRCESKVKASVGTVDYSEIRNSRKTISDPNNFHKFIVLK